MSGQPGNYHVIVDADDNVSYYDHVANVSYVPGRHRADGSRISRYTDTLLPTMKLITDFNSGAGATGGKIGSGGNNTCECLAI